ISRGWVWLEDLSGTVHGFGAAGVGVLAGLTMTPETVDLTVGTATVIQAVGEDRYGNPVPAGAVGWSSENGLGSILPISDTTATTGGKTGTALIQIVSGPASQIAVSPASPSATAGSPITLVASVSDAYGNPVSSGTVTWSASGGNVLVLTTDGRLVQYQPPTS